METSVLSPLNHSEIPISFECALKQNVIYHIKISLIC